MQVFSADMFETKFKGNVLSKVAGREYRDKVLSIDFVCAFPYFRFGYARRMLVRNP